MASKLLYGYNLTLFNKLPPHTRSFFISLSRRFAFTCQEWKFLMDCAIDLHLWEEKSFEALINSIETDNSSISYENPINRKHFLLSKFRNTYKEIQSSPIRYTRAFPQQTEAPALTHSFVETSDTIFGFCPARSEKTLCCNLRTIDAVLGCGYGCKYCALRSTYRKGQIIHHRNLADLLKDIHIEKDKLYHAGTGQSSDALIWGNMNSMLDHLMAFAREHPNVFLEFKTKSDDVLYFLTVDTPSNIFPSFSVNPEIIIENEEPFTASLKERLRAAKLLTDHGIRVAFHFHPIVMYEGWREDYGKLATQIMKLFRPENIVFISLGTLHWAKPVLKKIRLSLEPSKLFKMDFSVNPEGKLTCRPEIKKEIFHHVYSSFSPWHDEVFFYLCMETGDFWEDLFGFSYRDNEEFENHFLEAIKGKLGAKPAHDNEGKFRTSYSYSR